MSQCTAAVFGYGLLVASQGPFFLISVWCCIADIILELRHQLLCRHIWILFHPLSMEAHLLVHNAAHFPEVCRAAQLNKPNASALRIVSSMSRPVSY